MPSADSSGCRLVTIGWLRVDVGLSSSEQRRQLEQFDAVGAFYQDVAVAGRLLGDGGLHFIDIGEDAEGCLTIGWGL